MGFQCKFVDFMFLVVDYGKVLHSFVTIFLWSVVRKK